MSKTTVKVPLTVVLVKIVKVFNGLESLLRTKSINSVYFPSSETILFRLVK